MEIQLNSARKLKASLTIITALAAIVAQAQIPDLMNALDAGGRAMGMGSASRVTDANTYSTLDNPAGLAYVGERSYAFSFRNLPDSNVTAAGQLNNRSNSTSASGGKYGLTHVGVTFPYRRGTLGFSYTLNGYLDNNTVGDNLTSNGLTVRNLSESTRAQTDLFTFSYGERRGNMNIGAGVVVANQFARSTQDYELFNGNTSVGTQNSNLSGNGFGVGVVAGVQGDLPGATPMVWGLSLRSPIRLEGNGTSGAIIDQLPGKASLGLAGRFDQMGSAQEFLTWAVQTDYFYGGQANKIISRKNTFGLGIGLEYNLFRFNSRIPIRFGYALVPGGGNGFTDRNSFTFGVGYRPTNSNFTLDLNLAKASAANAYDIAFGVTYRPSK